MLGKRHDLGLGFPSLLNSSFGWVVSGKVSNLQCFLSFNQSADSQLNDQLRKFWGIDSLEEKRVLTKEEAFCEDHFQKNVKRLPCGRFQVSLPFLKSPDCLSSSKDLALKRLKFVEHIFAKM